MTMFSIYNRKSGETLESHQDRINRTAEEAERQQAQTFDRARSAAGICWETRVMYARAILDAQEYFFTHLAEGEVELSQMQALLRKYMAAPENSMLKCWQCPETHQTMRKPREVLIIDYSHAIKEAKGALEPHREQLKGLRSVVSNCVDDSDWGNPKYVKDQLKAHPGVRLQDITKANNDTGQVTTYRGCIVWETLEPEVVRVVLRHCQEKNTEDSKAQQVTDYATTGRLGSTNISWDAHLIDDCVTSIDTTAPQTKKNDEGEVVEAHRIDTDFLKDSSEVLEDFEREIMARDNLKKDRVMSLGATAIKPFKHANERIDGRTTVGKAMIAERDRSLLEGSEIIKMDLLKGITTVSTAVRRQKNLNESHQLPLTQKALKVIAEEFKALLEVSPDFRAKAVVDRRAEAKKRREGAKASAAA